jgi:hypothetical protein
MDRYRIQDSRVGYSEWGDTGNTFAKFRDGPRHANKRPVMLGIRTTSPSQRN